MRSIFLRGWLLAVGLIVIPLATAQVSEEKQEALRKMASALQPTVERLRGLEFKTDVPKGIKTEEELRAFMMSELDRDTSPEEFEKLRKVAVAIGLLPADLDLRQLMVDLFTEQVAGFYDPSTQRLYLIARDGNKGKENPMMELQRQMLQMVGTSEDEIYMAHELCHALEDQHFELLQLDVAELNDSDRMLASKVLVEGTATVLMFDFLFGKMGRDPDMLGDQNPFGDAFGESGSPTFDKAPEYVKQQLVFPYAAGMDLVAAVKKKGGWEAVNKLYLDPPASTEQALHPEKYTSEKRDQPTLMSLPDLDLAMGEGWVDLGYDVLGELGVQILLKQPLGKKKAEKAAAGWDGDVFQVYEGPNGRLAAGLASTWDTEEDAGEFFEGFAAHLLKRFPAKDVEKSETRIAWTVEGHQYAVVRSGLDVRAVLGAPEDRSAGLLTALGQVSKKEHQGGLPQCKKIEHRADEDHATAGAGSSAEAPAGELAYETPEGWRRAEDGTLTHAAGAEIVVKRFPVTESEEALFEHLVGVLPGKVEKFELVSKKPARIAGRIVRSIEFKGVDETGAPVLHEQVFFKVGEEAVLISFSSQEASIEGTRPGWEKVKSTLAVR